MKKTGILALAAFFLINIAALAGSGKTVVNGEKVTLTDGIYAKITTTKGDILVKFETTLAPMTSANFILLAEGKHPNVKPELKDKKYFDGLVFHRVIPDFMIQGGDPLGNGQGGPGYEFPNEVSDSLKHDKGVMSMANAGPNTNGSQFFITVAPTNFLDGKYSIFAKVIAGQAVADSISRVPRSPQDLPNTEVKMTKVEIIRVGKTFKKWDAVAAFETGKKDFETKNAKAAAEAEAKEKGQEAEIKAKYPNAKKTASGLMYVMKDVGAGEKPNLGDQVNVHYAGYFADGTLFDSSIKSVAEANGQYIEQREPYGPMTVAYGPTAQLIEGFKEGVAMLNVGGKATIIIPPSLGYGERGAGGVIPPNAWLIFDIELVEIVK